jgi:hypothetical protein
VCVTEREGGAKERRTEGRREEEDTCMSCLMKEGEGDRENTSYSETTYICARIYVYTHVTEWVREYESS